MTRVRVPSKGEQPPGDWFDQPDPTGTTDSGERGLRFACTQCGACCTGPSGYVLFTDAEGEALARRFGLSADEFSERYTRDTTMGRSLAEKQTDHGQDCIFLDRETIPGRAVCGVYEDRPMQCRTWPFWNANLRSSRHWDVASRGCPGINKGELTDPETIRLTRDRLEI